MASKVMTAPLCGRASRPPVAIDVTRCSNSGEIPAALAHLQVGAAQRLQGNAHAARGRAGDAGEQIDGDRQRNERVARRDAQHGVANQREADQRRHHSTVADLGGSVEDGQHGGAGARSPDCP